MRRGKIRRDRRVRKKNPVPIPRKFKANSKQITSCSTVTTDSIKSSANGILQYRTWLGKWSVVGDVWGALKQWLWWAMNFWPRQECAKIWL
jgi:hypothetical protein